jgi:hypothetical protein
MKKIKVSILALSVLVGGAVFASAASSSTILSTSDVFLTNTPTPIVWSAVYDIPTSALLNPDKGVSFQAGVVDTDNGGKISGAGNIIKKYYGNTADTNAVTAISSWYTTVKGNITASTMGTPTVKMTLKGQGYLAPGTNTTVIKPAQSSDGFPGQFNLNFKADKTKAVPVSTNAQNEVTWAVIGKLTGTITPATKGAKQTKVDETATVVVDRTAMDTVGLRVIAYGKKFGAILLNTDATGMGSIDSNKGTYKVTLKPVSGGSSSLQLNGQILAVTQTPYTNVTTINTADIKGKIQGQAVQSKGFKFAGMN